MKIKQFIKNSLILTLFSFFIEIAFRIIGGLSVFSLSLIRVFLVLAIISMVLQLFFSWFSDILSLILNIFLTFVFTFYSFFQMGFQNYIGVYASVNASSQLGAVKDFIREFFESFKLNYYFIFIPFILLIFYYVFLDERIDIWLKININKEEKDNNDKKRKVRSNIFKFSGSVGFVAIVCGLFYLTLVVPFMQNSLQTVSNKDLFKYPTAPGIAINSYGVIGYGILDLKSYGKEPPSEYDIDFEYENPGKKLDRKIDDSDWLNLIDEEDNKIYSYISKKLINRTITDYNDHTGLLEGKNLIVIMIESGSDVLINKELYPNFYKLYSEGIHFSNNFSPRNSCSTGNNEFSGMTGMNVIANSCTYNKYKENTYFNSIFNLFNRAGYNTSSMHNYTDQYYFRHIIHPNMGSKVYYGVEELGIDYAKEYENWASDVEFMEVAMDITLKNKEEPFMLWLTTVSSHLPYTTDTIQSKEQYKTVKNLKYSENVKRYMSKLKIFDNSLGVLLDRLEKENILDDTVIVMYADHEPYGLKDYELSEVLDYDLEDGNIDRTPLVIYNEDLKPEEVTKYTTYTTIVPTIANLFDLDWDPRFYDGMDVFSDDYVDVAIFTDGSWRNGDMYYNASQSSYVSYNPKATKKDLENLIEYTTERLSLDKEIITSNYYEYLGKTLFGYNSQKYIVDDCLIDKC